MTAAALMNVAAFDVEELDVETMQHVDGGVTCWWCAAILATFIAGFGDFVDGIADGYAAATS